MNACNCLTQSQSYCILNYLNILLDIILGGGCRGKQMFSNYELIFTVRWCHVFKLQIQIF